MVHENSAPQTSSFSRPKESVSIYEEKAKYLEVRLNELYAKFNINDLREVPEEISKEQNFKILSSQRGTREWLALRLKTIQGMISEGSTGHERALSMAEKMIFDWEKIESLEKLDQPALSVDELKKAA